MSKLNLKNQFTQFFSINSCPSERHDLTCSGHGSCLSAVGECQCDEDFKGAACNIPACPKNCEPEGVRRGICNKAKKRCDCLPGFTGKARTWTRYYEPVSSLIYRQNFISSIE
jgi:hypothetical protein